MKQIFCEYFDFKERRKLCVVFVVVKKSSTGFILYSLGDLNRIDKKRGCSTWQKWINSYFHVLRLRKNCEENRMICERFLSDYREIFEAQPRKSRDNHSKTSNRSSCLPNSLLEKS